MQNRQELLKFIKKCQKNPTTFISSFCKVKHPKLGVIPFKLFSYQKKALGEFQKHRFCVFKKCRQCFSGESMVWTPSGPHRIDSIKPGDEVFTLSPNGSLATVKVEQTFNNGLANCVEICTKSGHKSMATEDHKFLTKRGWVQVKDLTQDDILIEANNEERYWYHNNLSTPKLQILDTNLNQVGSKGSIKSIKPIEGQKQVYDLKVPPFDNYIVDGAVVHNCGVSTLTGAYALWYAMFFSNKIILIVSKRDDDAMEFLNKNVKFLYDNLPDWVKEIWQVTKKNEHELSLTNGSTIRSLTSSADTLRSNSGSLIIIDEAAFMPQMETMWAGGWSTIQTGGSVIVISTTNGIGNWYWKTWTDATNGDNDFNPIRIEWWDMDWTMEFTDELSGKSTKISPCLDLKKCEEEKDKEKYGPYWSPWLEEQHRQLTSKGSDQKFRQEILAEFMGTGNTVIGRTALMAIKETIDETEKDVKSGEINLKTLGAVDYVNPYTKEQERIDFLEELLIWKPPYNAKSVEKTIKDYINKNYENPKEVLESLRPPRPGEAIKTKNKKVDLSEILPELKKPHRYVIGADPSSGEADDYCGLQVLDLDTKEQVAELRIKAMPKQFAKMIDFIGRWYNNATVVCERSGIGVSVCQELDHYLMYPQLYRHKKVNARLKVKYNQIGYPTSSSTKPVLVKHLQDELGEDGWHLKSSRLYHELCIFIHLGKNRTGNESGSGNTDDLVLALALALIGVEDAAYRGGTTGLLPTHSMEAAPELIDKQFITDKVNEMANSGGRGVLLPFGVSSEGYTGKENATLELNKFIAQLGGIPMTKENRAPGGVRDPVAFKKHVLRYFRN